MAPANNIGAEALPLQPSKKRTMDTASTSGSSTTSDDSARKKKKRKDRKDRKDRKKQLSAANGTHTGAFETRRNSLGKAARDPRDEPPTKKRVAVPDGAVETRTRSPSPMINLDGLSRPSMLKTLLPPTSTLM